MNDKEKQIEEMEQYLVQSIVCSKSWKPRDIIEHLTKMIIPEDSVVLSREEMERLSSSHDIVFCDNKDCPDNLLCRCCEIFECPKNIPEYNEKLSANKHKLELFQKLCKERERADSWEDRYKLLEEELKQSRKETVEKIIIEIKQFLSSVETVRGDNKNKLQPEIGYNMQEVDDFLDKLEKEEVNL